MGSRCERQAVAATERGSGRQWAAAPGYFSPCRRHGARLPSNPRVAIAGRPADVHLPGKSSEGLSRGHLGGAGPSVDVFAAASCSAGGSSPCTYLLGLLVASIRARQHPLAPLALASPSASSPLHAVDHQPTQPRKTSVTAPRPSTQSVWAATLRNHGLYPEVPPRSDIPNRDQGGHG